MICVMVANVKKQNVRDWWEEARFRLKADYSILLVNEEKPDVLVGSLPVSADGMGMCVGQGKCLCLDMDSFGERLYNAILEGGLSSVSVFVGYGEKDPYVYLAAAGREGECLGRVGGPGSEALSEDIILPESISDSVLGFVRKSFGDVLYDTEKKSRDFLLDFYRTIGKDWKTDITNSLALHLIDSDGAVLPSEDIFRHLYLLDNAQREEVRRDVTALVRQFYSELYEGGELESRHDVGFLISDAENRLESYFSNDSRLLGRLGFRLDSIAMLNQEVQTDDVARVALLAAKDPNYAHLLGKPLEKWVTGQCRKYGLKSPVVRAKLEQHGMDLGQQYVKPTVSSESIARFKKKLKIG